MNFCKFWNFTIDLNVILCSTSVNFYVTRLVGCRTRIIVSFLRITFEIQISPVQWPWIILRSLFIASFNFIISVYQWRKTKIRAHRMEKHKVTLKRPWRNKTFFFVNIDFQVQNVRQKFRSYFGSEIFLLFGRLCTLFYNRLWYSS